MPKRYQRQISIEPRQPYINYPRNSLSWYQAVAFARWLDASYRESGRMAELVANLSISFRDMGLADETKWQVRLPTEWEWQWAAQNGPEKRNYPWKSGAWDHRRCNTSESGNLRMTAVGMYPHGAAECGALDMAGNLYEWCQNDRDEPSVVDGYDNGNSKVLRGGSFDYDALLAATSYRNRYPPDFADINYGVRLVCAAPITAVSSAIRNEILQK